MDRLENLFKKYLENQVSADEYAEMWQLMNNDEQARQLTPLLQNLWQEKQQNTLTDEAWDNKMKLLKASVQPVKPKRVVLWKYAAAASIIIVLASGLYFSQFNKNNSREAKKIETAIASKDVNAPQTNRAMITLADGRTVALDSVENGMLVAQGDVKLTKTADGRIIYNGSATVVIYNTLTNPKGSKVIDMTLADGSQVWLNAGSSITYPVAFLGNERRVSMEGEAYFEVAHNPQKPFHVKAGGQDIQVLGTHFNINSYTDEPYSKTTLLEGSVKVTTNSESILLKPGQQLQVSPGGQISLNKNVDVEEVVAWKNGRFQFNSVNIETIIRQAERWYDVDIVYTDKITETFSGGIPRSENISQLLKILEATGKVKFIINEKQITVKLK